MIELYTWPTPNGHKVQILLEELELPYRVHAIDIIQGAQLEADYLALNPNNKVPTLIDPDGCGQASPHVVMESGAILLYLAEKTGRFIGRSPSERSEIIQWLMWQMGGLGPMFGQAQHFFRYAQQRVDYAIERYTNECRRLLGVLEQRLAAREYVCGEYSIADVACFPWIRVHSMANQSLRDFPAVSAWYSRVRQRPAVERGLAVLKDRWVDISKSRQAQNSLFGPPQWRR